MRISYESCSSKTNDLFIVFQLVCYLLYSSCPRLNFRMDKYLKRKIFSWLVPLNEQTTSNGHWLRPILSLPLIVSFTPSKVIFFRNNVRVFFKPSYSSVVTSFKRFFV